MKVVNVKTMTIEKEMKYDGITLLKYKIEYPQFSSLFYANSIRIVNNYYRNNALQYQKYCETELFKMAVEQYKYDKANGYPIMVYEALQIFDVTYNNFCIISVYFDRYQFTGGAHGNTIRTSQTWNLQTTGRVNLNQLVTCTKNPKIYVTAEIIRQISESDPSIYFDNYASLVVQTFNPNSFYCKPEGLVIYFQQYDIAPYATGIPEFILPYSKCVIDPKKLCTFFPL
jgi:hypothetical protein